VLLASVILAGFFACSSGPAEPELPTWQQGDGPFDISPHNRFVLYLHHASREGPQGVYLLDRQSGDPPRLLWEFETGFDTPYDPRFSPDATRLVMTRDFTRDIYLYDIETGEERQLTFTNGNAKSPDWHPNGSVIAYARYDCGSYQQADTTCGPFILNIETGEEVRIRHNGAVVDGVDPRWSPDGSMLAIAKGAKLDPRTTRVHVFIVTPDGKSLTDLTPREDTFDSDPMWLSDTEILYESENAKGVRNVVWRVVNTETGNIRLWDVDLPPVSRREVSRDGRYVVYNDADPSGSYGVLYLQETGDVLGRMRQQLTTFSPIER
jgi:dipeptidyl aminopeptidase/acylaminoacyl peptidase